MKLLNDFFSIKESAENENESVYRLSLHAEHPIYQAHFQGNPITPGACIIQMLKELAEVRYATSFFIRSVKNVKFLIAINPTEHEDIDIHITAKADENGTLSLAAVIKDDKTVFC
jgi:3-hydroxyacyl-[acyl-carrier-protein] dehydratase